MADPVTASIILGVVATTSATVSAASATVKAEGAKDVADAQNEINQRRIDREAFSNLNVALAQEGSTSDAFQTNVQNVFVAEEEAKWESAYERNIVKHEANQQIEQAWIDVATTAAMSGAGVAGAKAEAAKLTSLVPPEKIATPLVPTGHTIMTEKGAIISTFSAYHNPWA